MRNRSYTKDVVFFFLLPILITEASDTPHPPREAQGLLSRFCHEGHKRLNPYAYATDGAHLTTISYLMQASERHGFYTDADFLHHLERSKKRTQGAGKQVLENIKTRNTTRLKELQQQNKHGLPPYLVHAITTMTNPEHKDPDTPLPPPPTRTTGHIVLDCTLDGIGFLAKQLDPEEYVLRADATQLACYLGQIACTSHCTDSNFATQAHRGLGRMTYVHDYIRQCIQEQNSKKALQALNHNKGFLSPAHITCFERAIKAINELSRKSETIGEESPSLSATQPEGDDIVLVTLNETESAPDNAGAIQPDTPQKHQSIPA